MIKISSLPNNYAVPTGEDVAGRGLRYSIPLKSNASGDASKIRSFQFRAISAETSRILSSGGSVDAGTSTISIIPKRRPPLMHQQGTLITVDTTGIYLCKPEALEDQVPIGTATFLVQPVTGLTRISRGGTTVDFSSGGAVIAGPGSLYLNGASQNGSGVFPYPRLLTIVYDASDSGPIKICAATGTVSFYIGHVSWSPRYLTAPEVKHHAALFYRKPSVVVSSGLVVPSELQDPALTTPVLDNVVPNPASWITV